MKINDALSVCVNESERHSMKSYRIVFIAVMSLLLGLPMSGEATTVYVNGTTGSNQTGERGNRNKPFKTILVALDVSIRGDKIQVAAGEYGGGVSPQLKSGVDLIGEGESTTFLTYDDGVRIDSATGFTLEGFTINPASTAGNAVFCQNSASIIIRNNVIEGATGANGIECGNSTDITIENNTIRDNLNNGIRLALGGNNTAIIRDNHIFSNGENGIEVLDGGRISISRNDIYNNGQSDSGVQLLADAGIVDLGGGSLGSLGENRIYDNALYAVHNRTSATVKAENNWWGTNEPSDNLFFGNVDYIPFISLQMIPRTNHVATTGDDRTGERGNSSKPFKTIQAGIDTAEDRDTVLVADGTYAGRGNINIDFKGKAITVKSINGAGSTVIDCENRARTKGLIFQSGETNSSVLDGFTIQNGMINSNEPEFLRKFGGGISCLNSSSPAIINCIIKNNHAVGGGGIGCQDFSSPSIINCVITDNIANSSGGGIGCFNSSSPNIINCFITNNSTQHGGGITCDSDSSPNIVNCIITGNTAGFGFGGGGINCVSRSRPNLTNCTITNNIADGSGSGIFTEFSSVPHIKNTIVWGNTSLNLKADSGKEIRSSWEQIFITYSNIRGGEEGILSGGALVTTYENNIDADPLFVDPANGDYRLLANSPCIDAGTNDGAPETDIDGNRRPLGAGIDMGAYEFLGTVNDTRPMVLIPAGEFQMGDAFNEGESDERPVHIVYLDAFYIDVYEVTNAQYQMFMEATGRETPRYWNDSRFNASSQPVVGVDWQDAVAYCQWAGKRLPTEAEWEKAARGGLVGKRYPWGDEIADNYANYNNTRGPIAVGNYVPNGYGVHDMAGNVWEWCVDWEVPDYYTISPKRNPVALSTGVRKRIMRGGAYNSQPIYLRVASRGNSIPENRGGDLGFRCAQDVSPSASKVANISLSIASSSLIAGSGDTATVTMTVTDATGNPVTGEAVSLTAINGNIPATATEVGNGVYTATYTAGTTPGDVVIEAKASNGVMDRVTVTLTEKEPPATTFTTTLTAVLQPTEVHFTESLNLLGVLSVIGESPPSISNSLVSITFTSPGTETFLFEVSTDEQGNYTLPNGFIPREVGQWRITTRFEGTESLQASETSLAFTVTKGIPEIIFDSSPTGTLGQETEIVGRLVAQVGASTVLSLKIRRPDAFVSIIEGLATEEKGVFRHKFSPDIAGDWVFTVTWTGDKNYDSVTETFTLHVVEDLGKVIIVLGGGNRQHNPAWETFNKLAEYVHTTFLKRTFDTDADIHFLSPSPTATQGADNLTTIETLELAITDWATKRVNPQIPLIDADGNGIANQTQDFVTVADRYLPANIISLGNPPEFVGLTEPRTLAQGTTSFSIEAELLGVGINPVWATIIPPHFDPTQRIDDWSALTFDEFEMEFTGSNASSSTSTYSGRYDNFSRPGIYTVIVNASNPDGSADSVQTTITVPTTEPSATPWDVDGNGEVNIFDLVLVAGNFGESGAGIQGDADVNGVVNIFDLVLVAGHFGESIVATRR